MIKDIEQLAAERLAHKLADVTIDAGADVEVVLMALQHVFVFWMSCVCADCRHNIAQKLKREIPLMLDHANRVATKTSVTCH
jgi:hypothetical protein